MRITGVVTASPACIGRSTDCIPSNEPFAFVLVKLDGADTALAHIVTDGLDRLKVGARVEAVWRPTRSASGRIRDIVCFRVVG